MSTIAGRIALVTGAAQGIGRAIALKLAGQGAHLALADLNMEKLNQVAAEIAAAGGVAEVFSINVSDEESVKAGVKAVLDRFGKIDILVNNAGITRDILSMRMKRADWDAVLAINLTGAFLMSQAVMMQMTKNRWGRIINMASVVGEMGQAGQANYAASKAGLIGITKSIARELGSRSITVNAIAPGFIQTAMTDVLTDEQKNNMAQIIPMGRFGTAEDIANAVAFLASEEAGYITGHVLKVNGGMYM